ncbi:unnamed protein product [Owenia fusiformis]|uniref:Survival of motor neuron-related-splicing factor 30 n=1 Tax=Owenia fusiformis TaxID=6347 RepID=A0A8S4N3M6_OWEFU|nr:unnamed protein product [Owenia fusiformis]
MAEELEANLSTYKLQLQQVEASLSNDPTNDDLLKLQKDLSEVIELTEDLIAQQNEVDSQEDETDTLEAASYTQHNWKVGDKCQALYSKDNAHFNATIDELMDDGTCTVTFEGWGNTEVTKIGLLKRYIAQQKRESDSGEGGSAAKRPMTKKDLIIQQKEYKKKKNEKKRQRMKELDEAKESEKNKWLAFNAKTFSKTNKGRVKKSIFATPDADKGNKGKMFKNKVVCDTASDGGTIDSMGVSSPFLFLELLVVLFITTILFRTSHGRVGHHKKCAVNSTAQVEKYDRVFVFAGEAKKVILKRQPWPESAYELHKLAGRETRKQIIQEGRNALDYFKNRYGLNVSHLITDDQIYNGEDVAFGNFTFVHEVHYLNEGPYRLIMESKGDTAHYYNNPPEVGLVAFSLDIHEDLNAGGTFDKTLYPGDSLGYGDYIIKTPKRCSIDGLTVIHFLAKSVSYKGGYAVITHADYGTGSYQLSLVTHDDGVIRGVNVLRFPAQ